MNDLDHINSHKIFLTQNFSDLWYHMVYTIIRVIVYQSLHMADTVQRGTLNKSILPWIIISESLGLHLVSKSLGLHLVSLWFHQMDSDTWYAWLLTAQQNSLLVCTPAVLAHPKLFIRYWAVNSITFCGVPFVSARYFLLWELSDCYVTHLAGSE